MIKYLALILLIVSCGTVNPKKGVQTSVDLYSKLQEKSGLYQSLLDRNDHRDSNGFIMTDKCDSLFFSGLLSAVTKDINILAARDEDGVWYRRPNKDCGPDFGNSRSTISRDMILGLYFYLWYNKDLDTAIDLMEQLRNNLYFLPGDGTPGELFMIPSMMRTLADIIKGLGGPKYDLELAYPVSLSSDGGYIAHLTVWHIFLRGEINGKISDANFKLLKMHAKRQPKNPLFQAVYHKYLDGNYNSVIHLLLDENEYPSHQLPSTEEHCDSWPIQRDYSEKDWGPCSPYEEHTGAELVILYNLILLKDTAEDVGDGPRETSKKIRA